MTVICFNISNNSDEILFCKFRKNVAGEPNSPLLQKQIVIKIKSLATNL